MVGTRLVQRLHEKSCSLVLVGRTPQRLQQKFPFAGRFAVPAGRIFGLNSAEELSVIINISGAKCGGDQPWSDAYKQVMTDSRLDTTHICV